jgi:hypothetical protein
MGSGHSNGRRITPRYEAVQDQLDATYDMNKLLKNNGYSPEGGLYDANAKAWDHDLIGKYTYNKNNKINRIANNAKHVWN